MKISKKMKILSLVLTICSLITVLPATAFAEDKVDTGVIFSVACDDTISLESDDKFKLTIKNSHTGITEEIMLDASAKEKRMKLEPGLYMVHDITYEGSNKEIKNKYAFPAYFNANIDYDYVYYAIGNQSVDELQYNYLDLIIKAEEVTENSKDPNESQSAEEPEESEQVDENEESSKKDEPDEEVEKPLNNFLVGFAPILVLFVIGCIVIYILHKKNRF